MTPFRGRIDAAGLLEGLNPEQKTAVEHGDGPLLVLAGAGSGKTRVITHRVALLVARGTHPSRVVAVTFTNKAAREMKERVAKLLGSDRLATFVGTFHSFALRLLRRHAELLGYSKSFSVYDSGDQQALAKRVAAELQLPDKAFPPKSLLGRVSDAKNRLIGPSEFARLNTDFYGSRAAGFYTLYQKRLRSADAMDFDDLIGNAVALFNAGVVDPETGRPLGELLRDQTTHLLVDEYQDTNHAQAELVRLLSARAKNVCAVGDDDQSIYRWRGAQVGNILDFERDFPGAVVVKLERNYRSTGRILEAATAVVNRNDRRHAKKLWTDRGEGSAICLFSARDEREEAGWIAGEIARERGAGRKLSDCAVLFRTNAQSRPFEDELRRRDWPYVLVGGVKFYERAEVKDTLAYLRLSLHPQDDGALLRIVNVPARGIGASTLDVLRGAARDHDLSLWDTLVRGTSDPRPVEPAQANVLMFPPSPAAAPIPLDLSDRARRALSEFRSTVEDIATAARSKPPAAALDYLLGRTGYRALYEKSDDPQDLARLENLEELLRAAAEFEASEPDASPADFVDAVSLAADVDSFHENEDKGVVLMTLHAAKGLEFPAVFLAGLEEGLLPHRSSMDDPEELAEERRLCYVGMTRARERLSLSWARFRSLYGQAMESRPSPFLDDVPEEGLELLGEAPPAARGSDRDDDFEDGHSPDGWNRFAQQKRNPFEPWRGGAGRDSSPGRGAPSKPPSGPTLFPKSIPRAIPSSAPPRAPGELRKGMKVRHAQYGVGVIMMEEGTGDARKFTIWFERAGRKKLVAKYAALQPA